MALAEVVDKTDVEWAVREKKYQPGIRVSDGCVRIIPSGMHRRAIQMDVDARTWLVNFEREDIPLMSAAEILHRIVALREIENAPHFMWRLPVPEENREFVARYIREKLNGSASFEIFLLMEELKKRGLVRPNRDQPSENGPVRPNSCN